MQERPVAGGALPSLARRDPPPCGRGLRRRRAAKPRAAPTPLRRNRNKALGEGGRGWQRVRVRGDTARPCLAAFAPSGGPEGTSAEVPPTYEGKGEGGSCVRKLLAFLE